MRHFRKATIKDVAKHAGVSTTTVSYFVSGRDTVCSPETAQRIREAIEHLHYTPSSLTSGLRQRPTMTIGVCVAHPFDPEINFGNTFFERLLRGIMYQADVTKYALLRYPVDVRNATSSNTFLDGRVDGLIFGAGHDRHAPQMVNAGMPTVVITRRLNRAAGAGSVFADETKTVDAALSHLWALGHRRIAHVVGPVGQGELLEPDDAAVGRLEAYTAWTKEHGIYDSCLVGHAMSWQALPSSEIVSEWRRHKNPPTAVFCANDALAIDFMDKAGRLGWRIPEDVSVIGVDNFADAAHCTPMLTTVDVPLEKVGQEAVRILVDLIHGVPVEQCRVCVPVTDIVVRASSAPLVPRSGRL